MKKIIFSILGVFLFSTIALCGFLLSPKSSPEIQVVSNDITEDYLIESYDDLCQLAQLVNEGYNFEGCNLRQTNDIYISYEEAQTFVSIGYADPVDDSGIYDYSSHSFRGGYSALDQYGVRHKIVIENALDAGVSSVSEGTSYFGEVCIFGSIYYAVITDVEVVGGTLVGAAVGSIIKDCKVETFGYAYAHKLPNYYAVGGIAAYASNCLIQNCMNSSDSCVAYWEQEALDDSDRITVVGGIVGIAAGGVILRCNNYGSVVGFGIVGGIAGYAIDALLSQCCGAIDGITINEEALMNYQYSPFLLAGGKVIIGETVGGIAGVLSSGDCFFDNDLMVWNDEIDDYANWTVGDGFYTIAYDCSAPFYDSLYPSDSSGATIDQCYNMTNIMYIGAGYDTAWGTVICCGGVVGFIINANIYGTYNMGTIFCDSSYGSAWIDAIFSETGRTDSVENRYNFLKSITYGSTTDVCVGGIFGLGDGVEISGCFNMGTLQESGSAWYDNDNLVDVVGSGIVNCSNVYYFYSSSLGSTFPNNSNYLSDDVSYYDYSDIISTVEWCLSGERWVIKDESYEDYYGGYRLPFLDWQVQTVFYESSCDEIYSPFTGKTIEPFESQFSTWLDMIGYYYSDFRQRIYYEEVYDPEDGSTKVLVAVDLVYGDKYQYLPIPDNLVDDEGWYFDSWRLSHLVMCEDPWTLSHFDTNSNMAITQDTTIKFYCPQDTGYEFSSAIIIRQSWDSGETYGSEDNYTRIVFFDGSGETIDDSEDGGYLTGYGDSGYAVKFIANNATLGELPTLNGVDINWYYETSNFTLYSANERTIVTNLDEYLYRSVESSSSDYYAVFVTNYSSMAYCTISFDANGGSGTVSSVSTYSSSITLPSNSFTRTGFTANGWNTSTNLTATPTYSNGSSYPVTGDATLYANWTPTAKSVTLSFKFNENGTWSTTARSGFAYSVSYATTTIASNSTTSSTQRITSASTLTMRAGQTISIKVSNSNTQGWMCMGYVIGSASPSETVSSEFTSGTYTLADNTTATTIYLCFKYVGATLKYDSQLKYFYFEDGMFPQIAVSSYDASFNTHLTNVADYSESFVSNGTTFYLHTYYWESGDPDEFMAYENQKFLGFIMPTTRTVILQDTTASSVTYASYTFMAGTTYWFKFEPIRWRVSAYGVSETDIPSTWSSGELASSVSLASDVLWWDAVNDSKNNPLAVGNSATETTFMSTLGNGEFMGGISWECWYSEDSPSIDCDQFADSTENAKAINSSVTWTGGEPRLASQAEIETYMSDKRSYASALVCVLAGKNQNQYIQYWTRDFGQQIGCGTYVTSSGVVIKNSYWDTQKGIRFSCTMARASYVGFL